MVSESELGGHGHELNGHRCPCPRHGHGRGMDTKFLEKRGVDMDVDTECVENRGVDMDMDTAWNRCPPNSDGQYNIESNLENGGYI